MNKKQIKEHIKTLEVRRGYLSEMNLHALVAYNAAIESLHKQIPIRAIKGEKSHTDIIADGSIVASFEYESRLCPSCNNDVLSNSIYCDHCGQKLDWE